MNQMVIYFVCLLLATLGKCSPVSGGKCDQVQVAQHVFDLGSLTSCTVPPSGSSLARCPNVNYPIPAVALQDEVSHAARIQSTVTALRSAISVSTGYDMSKTEACVQDFTNELCSFFFPRCSDDHSTVDVSFNCTRAMEQCPEIQHNFDRDRFCPMVSGYEGVYPIEPCKQKVQHVPLGNCAVAVDQTLPTWLAVQVKAIEGYSRAVYEFLDMRPQRDCADMWGNYTCRSVGRCWAQGCRLERTNSKDLCTTLQSCMRSNLSPAEFNSLSGSLACDDLPMEQERPATFATVITDPTSEPPMQTTTPPTTAGPSSQVVIVLPTSAGTQSAQGIAILVILSTVLLSCLWAL